MKLLEDILGHYLAEQVALEERLYKEVEHQISLLDAETFADVNDLLSGMKTILAKHFARLNGELDRLETKARFDVTGLGNGTMETEFERISKWKRARVSQMLRDDYTSLHAAAMGNSLLHVAALAAKSEIVAELALEHLANIAPFLQLMNELAPKVVVRELSQEFPGIELNDGEIASKNSLAGWKGWKKQDTD